MSRDDVGTVEQNIRTDVLIIGSGISGILTSLKLAKLSDLKISLITKTEIMESNTRYAQGGIAAVLSQVDSFEEHIKDTLVACAGICHSEVVEEVISKGPEIIEELHTQGVEFDKHRDTIELGKEGGHSQRRVAHVADTTGEAIQQNLVENLHESTRINVYEDHIAIDLVNINGQIAGAYVLNRKDNIIFNFSAKITILATGGAGKAFLYTSNPDISSGDGIAMAYRAGATIANMEFIQFHPTLYFNPDYRSFLITEALRGEGAKLRNLQGESIMKGIHPLEDLAPRDIVSRAIDSEMKRTGADHVLLDISHEDDEFVKTRFPNIYNTLLENGVNITKEPIPVVPAAHYTIGGIRTDVSGQTDLPGLFAIGEVSNTGLHGANRLASNSLLEGAVMATKAAEKVIDQIENNKVELYSFPEWETGDAADSDEHVIVSHNWDELRRAMWSYVGIVRTTKRLLRASKRISVLKEEVSKYYWDFKITPDVIELRNLIQVAELIVRAALFRKESRGAHFSSDYPKTSEKGRDTLMQLRLGIYHSKEIVN